MATPVWLAMLIAQALSFFIAVGFFGDEGGYGLGALVNLLILAAWLIGWLAAWIVYFAIT